MKIFAYLPRRTVIYLTIIVVLGGTLLVQSFERDRANTIAAPVVPDPIERIEIDDGREQLELVLEDGQWLVGEDRYPGSAAAVNRLVERVRGLPRLDIVTRRANLSEYGLAPEQPQRRTVLFEGPEGSITIDVGYTAASGDTLFGRIDGGREVVRLPRDINNLVNTHTDDYREVVMGRIPAEVIRRIEIVADGHGVVTLTPGDRSGSDGPPAARTSTAAADFEHWRVDLPPGLPGGVDAGDRSPVDPGRVRDLFQELAEITAAAFPSPAVAEPGAVGTDLIPEPLVELSVETVATNETVDGGAGGTQRIRIAPPDEQGRFLALATTSEYPFYLAEYRVRRLLLGIETYLVPYMEEPPPLM